MALTGILYNLDEFERLMEGSPLEVFLKGHLWVERALNDFLETATTTTAPLRLDRMAFSAKVNLCEAFGLIPSGICESIRKINKQRNSLAHNLEASIDDALLEDLIKLSPPAVRAGYAAIIEAAQEDGKDSFRDRLKLWFFVVLMDIGYGLLLYRYREDYHAQHIAFSAVRAVEEMLGTPPLSDEAVRKKVNLPDPPDPRDVWYRGTTRESN